LAPVRFRRPTIDLDADRVIDLRERLAPYVDLDGEPDGDELVPPDPLLAGLTRRVRPLRAEPYQPRHLAT
jgi:hypothetical protein